MSLRAIYATDKRTAALCTRMSRVGFAWDAERAAELAAALRGLEVTSTAACCEAAGFELNPLSSKQLQRAFFEVLGAPVFFRSELTGSPSLGVDAMRGYAALPDAKIRALALSVLELRRARKLRSTYLDAIVPGADGRVHPSWNSCGAVSGRWSCQAPGLMTLPNAAKDPTVKLGLGGIRSCYRAAPGHRLVAYDMSQLEMRIAAYASGDPTMIAACEGSDLHSANATVIFGAAFTECTDPVARKGLRTMAKSSGFAVCYMAEASTVFARLIAEGANVTLRQVEAMLAKMRRAFLTYYRWQDAALLDTVRTGYVYTPILGRRRWLGHDPSPTECANFPIQGGAADYMNERFPEVVERCDAEGLGVEPVAQVHDSGVLEVPEEHVPRVCELVREVNARPIVIASSGEPLSAVLPIDLEDSERWH